MALILNIDSTEYTMWYFQCRSQSFAMALVYNSPEKYTAMKNAGKHFVLTHCDIVTPYCDINLGGQWFR